MNTANVYTEALVCGIQATLWIFISVVHIVGVDHVVPILNNLKEWDILLTIVVLLFCYPLGIIVDRLADVLFTFLPPDKVLSSIKYIERKCKSGLKDEREAFITKIERRFDFLKYLNSRIRLMRSTALNVFICTVMVIFLINSPNISFKILSKGSLSLWIGIAGLLLHIGSVITYAILQITYDVRFDQAKKALAA